MKASDDPKGMTDDELEAAGRHHATLADTYRRMAMKAESSELRAANTRLAGVHQASAEGCRAEIHRRKLP